jgi:hypothetical protein
MIIEQRETVGLNQGGVPGKTGSKGVPVLDTRPKLANAGIDKKLSSRAQQYASIPAKKFESILAERRERIEQENERLLPTPIRLLSFKRVSLAEDGRIIHAPFN